MHDSKLLLGYYKHCKNVYVCSYFNPYMIYSVAYDKLLTDEVGHSHVNT